MTHTKRKPSPAAVAKSLRELEILFGKKRPPENDKGQRELAFGETLLTSKLRRNDTTKPGGAA